MVIRGHCCGHYKGYYRCHYSIVCCRAHYWSLEATLVITVGKNVVMTMKGRTFPSDFVLQAQVWMVCLSEHSSHVSTLNTN